jgi:dTDP-4-amino-4,6-dideoxygalactose transaminase
MMIGTDAAVLAINGGRSVRSSFLPFHRPLLGAEEERAVVDVLRSGWLTTGPQTQHFEKALADYVSAKHCVAMNSCTAALHLGLVTAAVDPDSEVITSPITFASTANVIVHCGAKPVFVDIEADTANLDPALVGSAVNSKTRAIVPVHMAGQPCDMDAINAVAARHNLAVIEDAAHALGAEYPDGTRVGSGPNPTAFSFYATKNLTSGGEGGAITLRDDARAERLRIMSLHGISLDAWKRYGTDGYKHWDILYPGYKYNMFDLQAAVGLAQFGKIDSFWQRRVQIKARLDAGLGDVPEIMLLGQRLRLKHAHHLYVVVVRTEQLTADRDTIMQAIQAENVGVGVHFRAVHLHPYYQERFAFRRGMFPKAEYYSDRTLSLPLYPKMSDQDADDVVAAVRKVIANYRR